MGFNLAFEGLIYHSSLKIESYVSPQSNGVTHCKTILLYNNRREEPKYHFT